MKKVIQQTLSFASGLHMFSSLYLCICPESLHVIISKCISMYHVLFILFCVLFTSLNKVDRYFVRDIAYYLLRGFALFF